MLILRSPCCCLEFEQFLHRVEEQKAHIAIALVGIVDFLIQHDYMSCLPLLSAAKLVQSRITTRTLRHACCWLNYLIWCGVLQSSMRPKKSIAPHYQAADLRERDILTVFRNGVMVVIRQHSQFGHMLPAEPSHMHTRSCFVVLYVPSFSNQRACSGFCSVLYLDVSVAARRRLSLLSLLLSCNPAFS